jgi:signal transduction histidine kinase
VDRVLTALTVAAFVALVLGLPDVPRDLALVTLGLGAVFTLLATVGFAHVRRGGRGLALGYVAIQMALGFAILAVSGELLRSTLLLLLVVSQSVQVLPLPWVAVVVATTPFMHIGMSWLDGLREGLGTLIAAVFVAVLSEVTRRERQARAELANANARLREYAAQAEQLVTTQERNRLAREIHDGLGHYLTVIGMQLQAARAVLQTGRDEDRQSAEATLDKAQRLSREALADVRRSVTALRDPSAVRPLPVVLDELATEMSAAGVPTELEVAGAARALPPESADALFRVAQEGLTNVRKHAGATGVRLLVDYRDPRAVKLEVCDHGVGAETPGEEAVPGFGLLGLRERAERLGGHLDVETAPERGLTLRIELPG